MKNFLIALMVPTIVFLFSCNNFGSPEYTVTVILGSGISGTPAAGTYAYKEFDSVDYSYGSLEGATAPSVKINGTAYAVSGTLTMYNNAQIEAYQTDIRGTWSFILTDTNSSTTISQMDITFSGASLLNGTFMDSQGNGGEWSIGTDGNILTITYSNWFNTVLTGTVSAMTSGTWTGFESFGTWTAAKK
jgi:hypothetical protein